MSALQHMSIRSTNDWAVHLRLHVEHNRLLLLPVRILVFFGSTFGNFSAAVKMAAVDVPSLCHVDAVVQQELGSLRLGVIPEVVRLAWVVVNGLTVVIL